MLSKRRPQPLITTDIEDLDYGEEEAPALSAASAADRGAAAATAPHRSSGSSGGHGSAPPRGKSTPKNSRKKRLGGMSGENNNYNAAAGSHTLDDTEKSDEFEPLLDRENEVHEPNFTSEPVQITDSEDEEDETTTLLEDGTHTASASSLPSAEKHQFKFSWRKLWQFTGPGWLMSIAFLDPGNLESDLQAGAVAGYSLLWVLLIATVIGAVCQILAARLGVVTGLHLAEVCRERYPRPVSHMLWLMTELAIIGADIQEVIGSAIAIHVLTLGHVPYGWGVVITAADTFVFLFLENYGIRKLEAFFAFLIGLMVLSFGVEYVISKPNQWSVVKGCVVPSLPGGSGTVFAAIGLVGSVIMPHNLYLHSALVQSRAIDRHRAHKVHEANVYNAIESCMALSVSFLINLFVVSVFAAAFYHLPLDKKRDIGLINAGQRLEERFADGSHTWGVVIRMVWAVGLLAAGQSSTMTGTYAGQFVMGGFLNLKIPMALRVTITRGVAIVPAVFVAVYATKDLDPVNEFINVLQAVQLPFALLPLLKFTSSADVMGRFANGRCFSVVIWAIAIFLIGSNVYIVATSLPPKSGVYAVAGVVGAVYASCVFYIAFWDLIPKSLKRQFGCGGGNGGGDRQGGSIQ